MSSKKDELIRRLGEIQKQIDLLSNFKEYRIAGKSPGFNTQDLPIDKSSVNLAIYHCKEDLLDKRNSIIIELENITA